MDKFATLELTQLSHVIARTMLNGAPIAMCSQVSFPSIVQARVHDGTLVSHLSYKLTTLIPAAEMGVVCTGTRMTGRR
jgi:hypothetical protein